MVYMYLQPTKYINNATMFKPMFHLHNTPYKCNNKYTAEREIHSASYFKFMLGSNFRIAIIVLYNKFVIDNCEMSIYRSKKNRTKKTLYSIGSASITLLFT